MRESGLGEDVDQLAPLAVAELHLAVREGEQGVVATAADVLAWMEVGAALAHDDGAGGDGRAVEDLDAEPLGVRITAVAGGAAALGLGHVVIPPRARPAVSAPA